MAAGVEGKFLSSVLYLMMRSLTIFGSAGYELITCVRQANENARNLISGVQFFIINNYWPKAR